jgi:hypothetical protein
MYCTRYILRTSFNVHGAVLYCTSTPSTRVLENRILVREHSHSSINLPTIDHFSFRMTHNPFNLAVWPYLRLVAPVGSSLHTWRVRPKGLQNSTVQYYIVGEVSGIIIEQSSHPTQILVPGTLVLQHSGVLNTLGVNPGVKIPCDKKDDKMLRRHSRKKKHLKNCEKCDL